jgi:hypothetical protein
VKRTEKQFRGTVVQYDSVAHANHVGNEVIIQLKSPLAENDEARDQVLRELPRHTKVQQAFDSSGLAVVALPRSANREAVVKKLRNQSSVAYAELHYLDTL